ncbi:extracellular matrix protein 1-like isoform X1 [Neolamprologus brichardi]|uniref:extracellular matrix protein 1-like isoform X1 n=1 Tax=Neolamprologus brichardi TaxID=32507 RepID=UPI0003EC0DA7|nr:extracellular matrix protein 1-like isoform X1 [Neolamprologus brichardi]XP_035769842.1 extracellular matrix protein 1-like isoform X1 [Neolamprologus brichardi]
MGPTWALICSTALLLVLLSSASEDERFFEQREVTFDIPQLMPEMQKEVDLRDYFDLQRPVQPQPRQRGFRPRPRGRPPTVGPRSLPTTYNVQFPLGRPTSENLQAICGYSDLRPRYPSSYFPDSGYGVDKLRASAVNNAEAWLSTCCKDNQTWEREVALCCATQAWELSVKKYCEEDLSIKHPWYHCCKINDNNKRLNCFSNDAPNPNYGPTQELPVEPLPSTAEFTFNPNTCQRTHSPVPLALIEGKPKELSTPRAADISFPPGRPTADTIESMCHNQRLRPVYSIKCLPRSGYEMVALQAKTINLIEKGFKSCCKNKKTKLNCADQKWSEELNKFCLRENGGRVNYPCCLNQSDKYSCFQQMSPDPYYNVTSAHEEVSLNKICDTHKTIKKKFPVGFPLKDFVTQCCPLQEEEKTACSARLLEEMAQKLCTSKRAVPTTVRRCCKSSSQETPQCISKIIMSAITKATNFSSQKKRKRCPIS